jgi:hypothetical protein
LFRGDGSEAFGGAGGVNGREGEERVLWLPGRQ